MYLYIFPYKYVNTSKYVSTVVLASTCMCRSQRLMVCVFLYYSSSSFFSVAVIKHPDQKQHRGGKDLFLGHSPSLRKVRAETQGRNNGGMLACLLASLLTGLCSVSGFNTALAYLLRDIMLTVDWALLHELAIKIMSHREATLIQTMLQLRFPLPR